MSKVKKHCSILNYLRHEHHDVADMIQDLCIGRWFSPKNGNGVTFLCPDKDLTKKLQGMISSDPDKVAEILQSLVLLDHLQTLDDFGGNANIPNALRKNLVVTKADNNKVELDNGAVVTKEPGFESRGNKANIAVFKLSDGIPSTGEGEANLSEVKTRAGKKGGGDYSGGRRELFDRVLVATCKKTRRNPPLEVLVSLMQYLEQADPASLVMVRSQLSNDTLASLAIVLEPYVQSDKLVEYIPNNLFNSWAQKNHNPNFDIFCYCATPLTYYNNQMQLAVTENNDICGKIRKAQESLLQNVNKPNIVSKLTEFYNACKESSRRAPNIGRMYAESELRVFSALRRQECEQDGYMSYEEAIMLFQRQCNLNDAYICRDTMQVQSGSIGFFFSSVYLLVRSDAILYYPGLSNKGSYEKLSDSNIMNENVCLALGGDLTGDESVYAPLANLTVGMSA